jgi:hypothetical protein
MLPCLPTWKSGQDPTDGWYKGKLSFFNFYIIPLAKMLSQCGVFVGVASDEYLNYAMKNRAECCWEVRGRDIVKQMAEKVAKSRCRSSQRLVGSKEDCSLSTNCLKLATSDHATSVLLVE